jgi:hypothetical protein
MKSDFSPCLNFKTFLQMAKTFCEKLFFYFTGLYSINEVSTNNLLQKCEFTKRLKTWFWTTKTLAKTLPFLFYSKNYYPRFSQVYYRS